MASQKRDIPSGLNPRERKSRVFQLKKAKFTLQRRLELAWWTQLCPAPPPLPSSQQPLLRAEPASVRRAESLACPRTVPAWLLGCDKTGTALPPPRGVSACVSSGGWRFLCAFLLRGELGDPSGLQAPESPSLTPTLLRETAQSTRRPGRQDSPDSSRAAPPARAPVAERDHEVVNTDQLNLLEA